MLGGKKSNGTDRMALPRAGSGEASMSIIGPGMNIIGDLVTDGTVRVEGRIEGTVRAGKAVVIGKGGEVVGDVLTQDAVIGGRVRGTVVAESRLELQASSDIEGQIRARSAHLQLEEGARFNGQIQMLDGSEALALPAPPRVENSTNS
jgi:cytoskeletal protein CcmA (bactofilin family)